MQRLRKLLSIAVINLAVLGLLLTLVEGVSSFSELVYDAMAARPVTERQHTEHDSLLGWINRPDVSIPDMYGKGRHMFTNSQRFRNKTDFAMEVPDGKVRVVCSGDSFALGYGVSNDDAWCQQLASLDPRLQTVNMGQAGYGLDQMYLWYRRDGVKVKHGIHLLAFITDDLFRIQGDRFLGYPKPLLGLQDGELVVRNVPVPQPYLFATAFNKRLGRLHSLNIVRIIRKLSGARPGLEKQIPDEKLKPLISAILSELARDPQAKVHALVYLPVLSDYTGKSSNRWRSFIESEARKNGLVYIDLIEAFRELPPQEIEDLYIGADDLEYLGYPGHYNEKGNLLVARILLERMGRIPKLRRLVNR